MKNLLLIQPKAVLKMLYPKAIWHYNRTEKTIYLSFDDGPIEGLTEWVLEELEKVSAKATFFCVGANIVKNKHIFQRIVNEGHVVANHTMHHSKGFKTNIKDYLREVHACEELLSNKIFRPPYGQLKLSQHKKLIEEGYKVVFWDVISYDYEKIRKEVVLKNVIKNTREGSIVLFHDNIKAEKNLKYALPLFLAHFTALGYRFETIY
ncbi:MAG: polysaccharide deacetylase family protein [Bacteroidota bacterium]